MRYENKNNQTAAEVNDCIFQLIICKIIVHVREKRRKEI